MFQIPVSVGYNRVLVVPFWDFAGRHGRATHRTVNSRRFTDTLKIVL